MLALLLGLIAVPGLALAAFTQNLSIGSTGAEVTELQTYLASDASIYPEGLVTGYYGELTKSAVARFQAKYGIDQVGSVGPVTRAKLNALIGTGGSGGQTGGDISAPVATQSNVSVSGTSATIRWSTNESARHRVMYGTVWPFLYASAPSASDTFIDATADVTLSGLSPNTRYYFTRESIDLSGNVMWTVGESFVTGS